MLSFLLVVKVATTIPKTSPSCGVFLCLKFEVIMAFYLFESEHKNRLVISNNPPEKTIKTVNAKSWIEAKKMLGFTLTDLQSEMLLR